MKVIENAFCKERSRRSNMQNAFKLSGKSTISRQNPGKSLMLDNSETVISYPKTNISGQKTGQEKSLIFLALSFL